MYTSVTVGADGLPFISYRDTTNTDLKVAHCSNVSCTSSTLTNCMSGNEGEIEKAIRDAADAIDKANALLKPKSLTLERIAKTLRDIAANLF